MSKQNSTGAYIARLTLILFLITAVVALLLGAVNAITKDRIAALNAQKTADSIRTAVSYTHLDVYKRQSRTLA